MNTDNLENDLMLFSNLIKKGEKKIINIKTTNIDRTESVTIKS